MSRPVSTMARRRLDIATPLAVGADARPVSTREWIVSLDEELLLADGFDDAILGVAERCSQPMLVVYDAEKCIEILMRRDGMSYEGASESFEVNMLGAWAGERAPLFLFWPDR